MMQLRWAALTESGKNFRIYAPNRMHVANMLKAIGEKMVYVIEAGYWHSDAKDVVRGEGGARVSATLNVPGAHRDLSMWCCGIVSRKSRPDCGDVIMTKASSDPESMTISGRRS